MNSKISRLVLLAGTVLALGSSAAMAFQFTVTPLGDAQFKPVHAGQTREEVQNLLGKPNLELKDRHGGVFEWGFNYRDAFGYDSEFDVYFDANGVVKDTYSKRLGD